MTRRTVLLLLPAVLVFASVLAPAGARDAAVPANALVKVALNPALKASILVDARGHTLYMYTADSPGVSSCSNDAVYHCSKAWPPLLTKGKPRAGKGAKASLLGTLKRADGALQVQYKGHPLYTDAGAAKFGLVADKKPGDVNGQRFLEIWFVLSPAGTALKVRP